MKRGLWVDFYYDFSDGYLLLGTMLPLHVQEKLATHFVTSKLNLAKSSPNRVLYFFFPPIGRDIECLEERFHNGRLSMQDPEVLASEGYPRLRT